MGMDPPVGGLFIFIPTHLKLESGIHDFPSCLPAGAQDGTGDGKHHSEIIFQPTEFKLLVEERRIVESLAGNENLEVQWRLATLSEAKAVVTQYHKYLSDHSLIKTVSTESPSLLPPETTQDNPSE